MSSASFLSVDFGGDSQNVAIELFIQFVVLQRDVESLIPRHIIENDRKAALYVGIHDHVQAADFVYQAEKVEKIHILQVYGDWLAGVPDRTAGCLNLSSASWRPCLCRSGIIGRLRSVRSAYRS